jgi:hypothetical protein
MYKFHRLSSFSVMGLLSAVALTSTALAAPPDAGLFTQYDFASDFSSVSYLVCGYLPESDGCYGFGTLGPFGHVGAILEGVPSIQGDSVQRGIYVVDVAGGTSGNEVILYHYLKTDTITSATYDTITTKLDNKVPLPLVGGVSVRCSMAANADFVVIGTDQSTQAVVLAKGSFALQTVGGFSNAPTVTSITSDAYGYVTVSFGGGSVIPGFIVIGPKGGGEEDGGGESYLASTTTGLSTKDVYLYGAASMAAKLAARPVTLHGTRAPLGFPVSNPDGAFSAR